MDIAFQSFSPDRAWPRQDKAKRTFMDNIIATYQNLSLGMAINTGLAQKLIQPGEPFQVNKLEEEEIYQKGKKIGLLHVYGVKQTPIVAVSYLQDNIIIKFIHDSCQVSLIN